MDTLPSRGSLAGSWRETEKSSHFCYRREIGSGGEESLQRALAVRETGEVQTLG